MQSRVVPLDPWRERSEPPFASRRERRAALERLNRLDLQIKDTVDGSNAGLPRGWTVGLLASLLILGLVAPQPRAIA